MQVAVVAVVEQVELPHFFLVLGEYYLVDQVVFLEVLQRLLVYLELKLHRFETENLQEPVGYVEKPSVFIES